MTNDYLVLDSEHWRITHRSDARHAGYLIVAAREPASDLGGLGTAALGALGLVLRLAEHILVRRFHPLRVLHYKLGFSAGFSAHFHVLPVTDELLADVRSHPGYADDPDGNDVILFVSREYFERPLTMVEVETIERTVGELRLMAEHLQHDAG